MIERFGHAGFFCWHEDIRIQNILFYWNDISEV